MLSTIPQASPPSDSPTKTEETVGQFIDSVQQKLNDYRLILESHILTNIALKPGELTGKDVELLLPQYSPRQVHFAIGELIHKADIRVTSVGTLATHYQAQNKQQARAITPALKDLTIQLPQGAIADLKRYAREQGTSVELEAAHLLREIIRLYKAQSVIPTN